MAVRTVYLAGPEVFHPDAETLSRRKADICRRYGLIGRFPLDSNVDLSGLTPPEQGMAIYRANRTLMDSCDACIANLTPFRGPSADVGTVFEIGYMIAAGKPVFAFTNDDRPYARRAADLSAGERTAGGGLADSDGMTIEEFGMRDNLMLDAGIALSGGAFVGRDVPPASRWKDLTAFEGCVRRLAAGFARA